MLEDSQEVRRAGHVEAGWHEVNANGRRDRCNGFSARRRWPTELGPLENVRVPRCRHRGLTEVMKSKVGDGVNQVAGEVTDLFVSGVSTRRVGTC